MKRYRWLASVIALCFVLACSGAAAAQTKAKQGESTEFRSPMVLETPFFIAAVDPSVRETGWTQGKDSLREYHCDNVSIAAIRMKLKEGGDGSAEITVEAILTNRPGHDKRVTLAFEVRNGEEPVTTFRIGPVKVDETDMAKKAVNLRIQRAKLIRDPITMMRITMTVMDD